MKQVFIALGITVGVMFALGMILSSRKPGDVPAIETLPSAPPAPATTTIENTQWSATAIGSESVEGSGITALFNEGQLSGSDGCNRYRTTYTLSGSTISIASKFAGTLMACPEETMVLANLYKNTLVNAQTYQIIGDQLQLLDQDGIVILTFSQESQSLSGTNWSVTGFNNGREAVTGPIIGTTLSLSFGSDNQVSGQSGCNSFGGTYTATDTTLTIGQLASTMMFCSEPEGIMEQESQYLQALQNADTYIIEGGTLTIRDASGAMQVLAQ